MSVERLIKRPDSAVDDSLAAAPLAGKLILILINSDEGGGVEHIASALSKDLAIQGATAETRFLFASSKTSTWKKLIGVARASIRLMRTRPDIVVSFQPSSSVIAGYVGRLAGCRVRLAHQANTPQNTPLILRLLDKAAGSFGFYSANIMNSFTTHGEFAAYPAAYKTNIQMIEHGLPLPIVACSRTETLAKHGIPDDRPIVFTAARLDPQKRIDVLLAALRDIPNARLVVAGAGPERDNLAELAKRHGVHERVSFIGRVPRQSVLDLNAACNVFVFPTLVESFGLAPVEAAALGVPVIVSDIRVLREVLSVDAKSPALFVEGHDPHSWSQAINAELETGALRAGARAFAVPIQKKYSEASMLLAYRELFAELLAPASRRNSLPAPPTADRVAPAVRQNAVIGHIADRRLSPTPAGAAHVPIPSSSHERAAIVAKETPSLLLQGGRHHKTARMDAPAAGIVAKKRVLVIINSNGGGGVEHLAGVLARDLEAQGAQVEFHYVYSVAALSCIGKIAGAIHAAKEIHRKRPDVLMAFQPTSAAIIGLAGALTGCRTRIVHQSNMPDITHIVPRMIDSVLGAAGFYSCIIANSAATEAAFARHPSGYRRHLRRIDHGVAFRQPRRDRAQTLAAYGLPDDQPIICSASRIVPQKSLHTIVEALALMQRGRFVVAGQGSERDRIEQMAARLGVSDRVHFLGQVDNEDLMDLFSSCDVLAFPSLWETFGLALVEAAMQGAPVVASGIDTSREVLAGASRNVRFVDSWQARAWADALNDILADGQARPDAREFIPVLHARYGLDKMLHCYQELYSRLLAEPVA